LQKDGKRLERAQSTSTGGDVNEGWGPLGGGEGGEKKEVRTVMKKRRRMKPSKE